MKRLNPHLSVAMVVLAGLGLLALPKLAAGYADGSEISRLLYYQLLSWTVVSAVVCFTLIFHRAAALRFLRINKIHGSMAPVRWLLIKDGENWARQGWQIAIVLSLVTAIVVWNQLGLQAISAERLFGVLPLAFGLALSNSLAEELIFRHSIVSAYEAHAHKKHAPVISGVLFGGVHYFGAPGGFIGVLMAGVLGWLLAKSMQETGGLFWAWSIHACLDVVIFACILMAGHA